MMQKRVVVVGASFGELSAVVVVGASFGELSAVVQGLFLSSVLSSQLGTSPKTNLFVMAS